MGNLEKKRAKKKRPSGRLWDKTRKMSKEWGEE